LLARSLLSGTAADLAPLLREVAEAVGVPVAVSSDTQVSEVRRRPLLRGAAVRPVRARTPASLRTRTGRITKAGIRRGIA
jgi:hypothetical protein